MKALKSTIIMGIAFSVMATPVYSETKNLLKSGVSNQIGLWPDNTFNESGMVVKYFISDVDENNNEMPLELSKKSLYIVTDIVLGGIGEEKIPSNAIIKCTALVSPYNENKQWTMDLGFHLDMNNNITFKDNTGTVKNKYIYSPNTNYRVAWTISNEKITAIINEPNGSGGFKKVETISAKVAETKSPKYISVERGCSWETDNHATKMIANLKLNLVSVMLKGTPIP